MYDTVVFRHKWALQYRLIIITVAPLCTYFILVKRRTRHLQKLTYYYAIYFIYLYIFIYCVLTSRPRWHSG